MPNTRTIHDDGFKRTIPEKALTRQREAFVESTLRRVLAHQPTPPHDPSEMTLVSQLLYKDASLREFCKISYAPGPATAHDDDDFRANPMAPKTVWEDQAQSEDVSLDDLYPHAQAFMENGKVPVSSGILFYCARCKVVLMGGMDGVIGHLVCTGSFEHQTIMDRNRSIPQGQFFQWCATIHGIFPLPNGQSYKPHDLIDPRRPLDPKSKALFTDIAGFQLLDTWQVLDAKCLDEEWNDPASVSGFLYVYLGIVTLSLAIMWHSYPSVQDFLTIMTGHSQLSLLLGLACSELPQCRLCTQDLPNTSAEAHLSHWSSNHSTLLWAFLAFEPPDAKLQERLQSGLDDCFRPVYPRYAETVNSTSFPDTYILSQIISKARTARKFPRGSSVSTDALRFSEESSLYVDLYRDVTRKLSTAKVAFLANAYIPSPPTEDFEEPTNTRSPGEVPRNCLPIYLPCTYSPYSPPRPPSARRRHPDVTSPLQNPATPPPAHTNSPIKKCTSPANSYSSTRGSPHTHTHTRSSITTPTPTRSKIHKDKENLRVAAALALRRGTASKMQKMIDIGLPGKAKLVRKEGNPSPNSVKKTLDSAMNNLHQKGNRCGSEKSESSSSFSSRSKGAGGDRIVLENVSNYPNRARPYATNNFARPIEIDDTR